MYVAFIISSEFIPVLQISKLILPIFILIMLQKKELVLMLSIDFGSIGVTILRMQSVLDAVADVMIAVTEGESLSGISREQWIILNVLFMFYNYGMFYIAAWQVIKKKKLRERE